MRIIISAGGTGGHIYPALALCEKVKEKSTLNKILYVGTNNRMEKDLIPSLNIDYRGIEIYGKSKSLKTNIKNFKYIIKAYRESVKIIKEFKPEIIVGFGSYVTLPLIFAAKRMRVKVALHEQNYIPGKTNKFLSKYADVLFCSFLETKKYLPNVRVYFSGNPCGERALTVKQHDKTKLGFSKNKKLIIIVMGSMGSGSINQKIMDFLKNFKENDKEILFIAGKAFYESFDRTIVLPKTTKVVEFYENLPGLMKEADLIISRAGASTISEILALRLPSIIIPSPFVANNHQYYNALDLKQKNISMMIEEKDFTTELLREKISYLLDNKKNYLELKKNLEKQNVLYPAETMYNEIKEIIKK